MLFQTTLRNLWKNEYTKFLENFNIENLSKRLHTSHNYDYSNIIKVVKEEISNPRCTLTTELLDDFLFKKFFYLNNNYHYIYRMDTLFETKTFKLEHIQNTLKKITEIKLNESLINFKPDADFKLCTTRLDVSNDMVKSINLLIYVGKSKTRRGEIDLYSAIQIDIQKKLIAIKFNLNILENHRYDKMLIIDTIINKLTDSTSEYKSLKLRVKSHNETQIRKTIHKLFKELSEQAELLLNSKVPKDTEEKISQFLDDMKISKRTDYINQIKAVLYQDISKTFNKTLFDNGWIFRFVFREGDTTRASSTTDDYEPIYSKKVYWNLKELMFKSNELLEAGILWNTSGNTKPVLIKLEQKSNVLIVHYYQEKSRIMRKEKEDFVLRKINQYLP